MSIRHFIDENNNAYDVPENEVDEFMQSVSASGVKVTEEQQKNNKIRIFSDDNGKTYDVPENEVDEFMQSASSSGANVKEINLDNQEKRSFRDEEGKIYDVPANEIDEFMQSVNDSGKNVNEIKSLGIFGTIKKNQEAQFGEMSTGELLYSMIPIIGKAEQTRQEMNERALFNGEFNDTLEGGKIAAAAGIPQDQIDKIYEETGSGGRNRFGGWNTHDMVEFKKRMKALAEPLIKKRIQTRQAAQQDLQNNDLNLAQRIVTGLAGATELAPMMNTGAAIATLPADAVVRGARMSMPELTIDDKGEIVEVTKGDSDSAAIVKGAVGSAVERFIWMGLGKVLKAGGAKLLEKSPGLDNALGYVAGKPLQWSAAVGKKLSESEGGRLLLKTSDILGKVEDKIHLGSLPAMMVKSRLTELSNEVVGLNLSNDQQGEEFTKWFDKFVSVKDNLDLMVDLIGIHALMGGYSALKARSAQKSFREDAGKILGEYLSNEQIQKLSNEDISMLTRMVTSKGLTVERAEKFLDDARADLAEAEEKVSSGRKLTEIQDGLETIKKGSQQAIDEGQKIVDKMKSDEQRAAESVELERQEAIKAAEAEQAAAETAKEAERIDQSNFRGASTEEQLASLDEREVNSWEDAAAKNLIHQDDQGRWTGGARQAINIHLNGTEKMKSAVKEGRLDGDLAEELLSTSYCELGDKPKVERDALIDRIIDQSDGNPDTARKLLSELTGSYATMDRQPQTALEGAENAARMKGTELRSVEGPMMGCERFPEVKVTVNSEGIFTEGLTDKLMSDPRNAADVAALLTRLSSISEKTGLPVNFAGDENAAKVANDIASAVHEQGLAKIQRKMDTRAKLFDVLAQTTLDKGTTFTEAEFKKALAETSNGRRYVDKHGNIYGFKSADGTLHFNPAAINFNTPIHEYGHLALEAVKKINPTLWKKGMELIKKHEYFDNIKKMSEDPEHEYSYLKGKEEDIADEALTTLIGDRGERIVENTGLGAELKSWLKEFWNAFKNAFGVADLTEQQIENMTIGDFVDAINAELLRGKEFGTKKQRPLEKKSIRRYDEDQNSGSNGILRWKNDRGYLFAIPVDMERTQPGGKVVFATDDANITDWIQNRLNGYTLRLSKNGKIYVEGRDGLPSDLADIFGRYPRIGNNDGIYNDAASSIGRADYADGTMTPERLVEMLAKDRENYIAWNEQRNSEQNHYEMEALRDAEEAKRRWEDSGMSVIDYIRSRAEEGVPEFDLDWETAREIANDRSQAMFSVRRNNKLSKQDYKKKKQQATAKSSLLSEKDPGRTRGVSNDQVVSVVRQSLEAPEIISQLPVDVKPVYDGLVEIVRSLEDGRKVLSLPKPVTENNFINALFKAGIDQHTQTINGKIVLSKKKSGNSSGYRISDGRTTRVSTHPANAYYFIQNGTDNNISFVIRKPSVSKPFTPDEKANVIEIVYNRTSLKNNPEDMARIVHDIARFVATGEFNDTLGAAKYNYSGSKEFIASAMKSLLLDAGMREDSATAKEIIKDAKRLGVKLENSESNDAAYEDAVKRGDTVTALKILKDAYEKAGYSPDTAYRISHKAPTNDGYNSRLDNIEPMFGTSERSELLKMGYGRSTAANAVDQIMKAKGNPEAIIDIYRAVPLEVKDTNIRSGDWISLSREYVKQHGESWLDGEYKILHDRVPAKFIFTDGNMLEEAGFDDGIQKVYKNVENGTKIAGITYDEQGNLIPLSKRFDQNNPDVKFSVGDAPRINGRNFIAGRAMTAEDYGRGEQTPGAMAAATELDQTHAAPISMYGKIRKMSLPLSELEQLRKMITGNKIPAQLVKRMPGGISSSHDRSGQIFIAADILGMVDKTDAASQKELLKQHGFFLNEDPTWTSAHTPTEIRNEKRRSEDQLADQLIRLSNERANGTKSGGLGAVRQVFADELAAMIMDMPRQTPSSVLGTVQKIGRGLRAELKDLITAAGTASGDVENAMRGEAEQFLDWAYGNRGNRPDGQPISSYTINELSAKMFGAWLVMPLEVENRAPQWSKAIETTIANTPKLADAFRELTVRSMSEQATAHLEYRIKKQQSIQTEQVISKLRSEREDPIGTGSKKTDAIEGLMVAFHDKMSPVYLRIDEKVKQYIQAKREILKNTTDPAVKASVQQQIDAFMGNIGDKLHKLELSRTAYERGAWNEGRRYFIQMVNLENKASAKWGLAEEDRSLYLDLQRIIETQGRSASDGISPQQASIMLGDMARKLGTDKWDLMRQYGDEFFAIHEREILNDSRLERMLGKGVVDYFRTQSHYVTTKRTWSEDDLAAIEIARKDARNKGVAGGDDIVSQMYQYAGKKGAGELIGESLWNAKLKGSMAAKQEVRSATWEKIDPLMASVRRNQQILDLRDALLAADVTGVRDLPRTEGSKYPDSRRYGHINYMENGNKRVLVVPKQISDAFKTQPDNAAFITKVNGLVRKAFIDWNIAYTPQNVKRNQASLEMNMPGMRETYLKTALRATVPGAAPLVDLATQFLVRKFPALGNMFGKHTVFFHLPKAERWAKIVEDPTAWQRQLWDAEQRGDVAEIQRLNDDYYGVMEMLKGNFLVPAGKAYSNEPTTFGFAFDAMARKGLKTLEMIERETNSKTKLAKFVDAINIFKKNQAQNEHEDVLAKTIGYLHDRMFYSMQRNQVESGLAVKRNVSIAEGERAGKLKRGIQQTVAQFYNMCEKGITRHWRNFSERPGEMIARDAKVWIGRAIGSLIAYGALQKFLLDDSDGDEQKAKEKYGKIYDYAAFCHRAYQNCSQYVKDNYNFTPVWTSDDGMTSLIMGGALTDEDKLIVPTADLFSKWIAYNQGIGERPDFGPSIANSTFKAITPDLQLASPALTLVRDTVEAMFVDNPTDYFRNAPTYDEDLYRARNESWEMRGKFAAAMAARVWNDLGGRGLVQPDVNGVDNGRGNAPESIESILRNIPVMSPALGRLFKIQVGSPEKLGQPIANEKKTTQAIINVCAKSLFNSRNEDQYLHEFDPAEYERRISRWSEIYDLTPLETAKLRAKYLNAVNQHRNRSAYDLKKLMQLRKEARKQGRDEADIWIMLGEM